MTGNFKKLLLAAMALGALAAIDWWSRLGGADIAQPIASNGSPAASGSTSFRPVTATARAEPGLPRRNYASIFDAPLFSPLRAGPTLNRPAEDTNSDQREAILVGVAGTRTSKIAMISHAGRTHRIEVGGHVDGWTVIAIRSASVELKRGHETRTISLRR